MAKKLNVPVIVFASIVLVGFILVIVSMNLAVVTGPEGIYGSVGLFDEGWAELEKYADMASSLGMTIPDRTLALIGFVVVIVGAIMALVNSILGIFQKGIKGLGIAGGVIAIVGGVLVLAGGMMMAGQFNSMTKSTLFDPGIGIWLGGLFAIVLGIMGIIAAAKGSKKKAAAAPAA